LKSDWLVGLHLSLKVTSGKGYTNDQFIQSSAQELVKVAGELPPFVNVRNTFEAVEVVSLLVVHNSQDVVAEESCREH
jgi:hypothetical protein